MKAVIWTNYGSPDVLQLQEIEKPSPKEDEVLIKIYATTVETGDCEIRQYKIHNWLYLPLRFFTGTFKPKIKILGQQLAGEVEAVGKDVTLFKKGDAIFGAIEMGFGTYTEYRCQSEKSLILTKPRNMSFEEAATIPVGGLNSLHFLRKAKLEAGQKILIYGTSGSIGSFAVQLAKHFGAEVTGVCSTDKLDLVTSLGADKLIDYTQEDFSQNGESYDVIFDTIGKSPFSKSLKSLKKEGIYLLANPTLFQQLKGIWASMISSQKVICQLASYHTEDLNYLKDLIEAGELKTVIDRSYPLEQTAEAHRYVELGHKKGNVVITIE